ncbi:N2227-domain-containing protein [Periconia macrospinosa]|uniref:N2227-domain-containing protein n=1 Tax=Periconia macrospinosa TaxID=97972 RepID=A0A2V1DME2_9PLEO|nr:N2227-domain-containing protein [Periconia macrospinosa]
MKLSADKLSPRHRIEKAHLLKRLDRKKGKWGPKHPRHRLLEALFAFSKYRERSVAEVEKWRKGYKRLSKGDRKIMEAAGVDYKKKLDDIEALITTNAGLCESIIANALSYYAIEQSELNAYIKEAEKAKRQPDRTSVTQALKHFVRDWSSDGAKERDDAFSCIIHMLHNLGLPKSKNQPLKVLLPGAGLGRLAHEIACLGEEYEVTTNEYSPYINLAYNYLLNHTTLHSSTFNPFIDSLSHRLSTTDILRPVTFPATRLHPDVLLVEGDFTTILVGEKGNYDVLITHFFIDTAQNLISYFSTIHALLKKGGKWVNFGPLMYGTNPYVQLSLDEIVRVVEGMGFHFEDMASVYESEDGNACGGLSVEGRKVRGKEARYGGDEKALTRNVFLAQGWVAVKN